MILHLLSLLETCSDARRNPIGFSDQDGYFIVQLLLQTRVVCSKELAQRNRGLSGLRQVEPQLPECRRKHKFRHVSEDYLSMSEWLIFENRCSIYRIHIIQVHRSRWLQNYGGPKKPVLLLREGRIAATSCFKSRINFST